MANDQKMNDVQFPLETVDQTDPRYQEALDQRNKLRLQADLLGSFQKMIEAGAAGSGFKADTSMADVMRQRSEDPLTKYKTLLNQEAAAKKEKRTQAKEEREAKAFESSEARKAAQEQRSAAIHPLTVQQKELALDHTVKQLENMGLKNANAQLVFNLESGKDPMGKQIANAARMSLQRDINKQAEKEGIEPIQIPENVNLLEISYLDKYLDEGGNLTDWQKFQMAQRQTEEKRRQEGEKRRQKVDERKEKREISEALTKRFDAMKKNKVYQELDKQGLTFAQAESLISEMEKGNEIALGSLGTKMARSMGEVGVLTDQDVKRYIEAQSLVQKAKDKFGRAFLGQLSKDTVQDIKNVTDKMQKGFNQRFKEIEKEYVDQTWENYGKDYGMSKDDVRRRFGITPKGDQIQSVDNTVLVEAPTGERKRVLRDRVQKYIDKGAKVVE